MVAVVKGNSPDLQVEAGAVESKRVFGGHLLWLGSSRLPSTCGESRIKCVREKKLCAPCFVLVFA